MAITIKELLAADTISEAVDKINFNFDQIMLNGGGPPGGPGGPGGPGIPGPKGPRGSVWHYGDSDPNNLTFLEIYENDYYLQKETDSTGTAGDVWIYNQISEIWTNTGINLQGPSGLETSAVFDVAGPSIPIGTDILDGLDFAYLLPDNNLFTFLSTDIKSLVLGGYPMNAPGANPSNPNNINNFFNSINSTNGILFVNSPNTAPQIVLSSTNEITATSDISEMSSIESDIYDVLRIKNKRRTDTDDKTLSGTDFSGIVLSSLDSDIDLYSARDIKIIARGAPLTTSSTGTLPNTSGNLYISASDGLGSAYTNKSRLSISKLDNTGSVTASLAMGPAGTNGANTTLYSTDNVNLNGKNISNISNEKITFFSATKEFIFNLLPTISVTHKGLVVHDNSGKIGSMNFSPSFANGVLSWDGTNIQTSNGSDLSITRWNGNTEIDDSLWYISDTGNMYPDNTSISLGTSTNRLGTIYLNSIIDYNNTISFRNSSNNRVTIQSNGKLSINTTVISEDLNVNNSISLDDNTSYIKHGASSVFNPGITPNMYILGKSVSGGVNNGGNIIMRAGNTAGLALDGNIYLLGGTHGTSTGANPYAGSIYVGIDETGTIRDNKFSIRRSSPQYPLDVNGNKYEFSAKFSNGEIGANENGSIFISNEDTNCGIKFFPKLPASYFNIGVADSDSALIFSNGVSVSTGLVIGPENKSAYIRIDGDQDIDIYAKQSSSSNLNIDVNRSIFLDFGASSPSGLYIGNNGNLPALITMGANHEFLLFDTSSGSNKGLVRRMHSADVRSFIGAKSFVINHTNDKDKYLVHACIEGPENTVFYRGESKLENGFAEIILPDYFESLTHIENRTVQLTSKITNFEDYISNLASSEIIDGKFKVKCNPNENLSQSFYWEVKAVRKDIPNLEVEPSKNDYELKGDGPYTYLVKK